MLKNASKAAALLLSTPVIAHPGHDHAHWLSDPIHVLSALSIAAVALTAAAFVKRNKAKSDK